MGGRDEIISLSVDLKQTIGNSYRIDFRSFQIGRVRAASQGQVFAMRIQELQGKNFKEDVMVLPTEVFNDLVSEANK